MATNGNYVQERNLQGNMRINMAQVYGKSLNYTDIPNNYFREYNIKKGLRNEDGTGVAVGLTRVSDVVGYRKIDDGIKEPVQGNLLYRGISLEDLVHGTRLAPDGFEEACFLLLFGYLPNASEFEQFRQALEGYYELPDDFVMDLLRSPSENLMNKLQHAVLDLYNYDLTPDDTDPYQTLLKGLSILAKLPSISCYAYQSKIHHFDRQSLIIHYAKQEYSIAENILYMLRPNCEFTENEAKLLDTLLIIHADHGGGNNSTFTNVVISSTGTDIYSTVTGSIGALKGPRHGGANIRACEMMEAVVAEIGFSEDEEEIRDLIRRIMQKKFYDRSGLVYGFGHAVYTLSDPRAELLREVCKSVAHEKGRDEEYAFYERFERITRQVLEEVKGQPISNNVDYYSGYAYSMLGIPRDLFTPLFVCARMVGWLAHNIENKLYDGRIMRPANICVAEHIPYVPMDER